MKNIGWMTFVVTLALALGNARKSSYDEFGRRKSLEAAAKVEQINRHATAIEAGQATALNDLNRTLSNAVIQSTRHPSAILGSPQ